MRLPHRIENLPTRRQILAACAAIRAQWTPAERRRRIVGARLCETGPAWTPPQIATANCLARVRKLVAEASA